MKTEGETYGYDVSKTQQANNALARCHFFKEQLWAVLQWVEEWQFGILHEKKIFYIRKKNVRTGSVMKTLSLPVWMTKMLSSGSPFLNR